MEKLFKDMEDAPDTDARAKKGDTGLDSISELRNKLSLVIEKVKSLKQEKAALEARVSELERKLSEKDDELRLVSSDKLSIKDQIADLLSELEAIETS